TVILYYNNNSLFFSRRRRHTRSKRDWSSDVCSSDLPPTPSLGLALDFVRVRAQGMASAAAVEPTGMAAVLGGDQDEVIQYLENRSEERRVWKENRVRSEKMGE